MTIWIVQNADGEVAGVYASREAAMLACGERLGIAADDWSLSGPWLVRRSPEDAFDTDRLSLDHATIKGTAIQPELESE